MASSSARKNTRVGFWTLLPVAVAIVAFLAALPWLKATIGGPMVGVVSAAMAILVMGYANLIAIRHQRSLDEVEKYSAGFATQWGMPIGQTAFVLLAMLPPVQDFATDLVNRFAGNPGTAVDQTVVEFAMILGFCALVLLQTIGMAVVNTIWWLRKQ